MPIVRVSVGLILTLPVCACVPLVPPAQLALPYASPNPDADQAIDRTRRAFTQSALSGDVQAMARYFTPDGMVITTEGDTVRGRAALAEFFATERAGPSAAVLHFGQFSRESYLQKCHNGGNERGRFRASATVWRPYAVRWQWDSLGNAEIQRINFQEQSAVRRIGSSGCYIPLVVQQRSKRIGVSLLSVVNSTASPGGGVESAMRQQGWADGGNLHLVCPSWDHCAYHSTPWTHLASHERPIWVISFRFSPHLATEVIVGARPSGSTIGLDSAGTAQLEAIWSGRFMGAAATYVRSGFQVGLGPVVETMEWHLVRANPYNVNLQSQRSETAGRVKPVGIILDVGYHQPVIGPFRLDMRAQLQGFGKTTFPGGAAFLNAPFADRSAFIGIGLGMVL